jgi:demethylmenaquinone methyltransferase/2-methoxy-6-polyprenyl-1,4-benzoquinol methylase
MNETVPLSQTFGLQSVDEHERELRIRRVFEAVAPRYDLMNDLMSMGIHRWWKRVLVRWPRRGTASASSTSPAAPATWRPAWPAPGASVTVVDPSEAMMAAGRARGLTPSSTGSSAPPNGCRWPTPRSTR